MTSNYQRRLTANANDFDSIVAEMLEEIALLKKEKEYLIKQGKNRNDHMVGQLVHRSDCKFLNNTCDCGAYK